MGFIAEKKINNNRDKEFNDIRWQETETFICNINLKTEFNSYVIFILNLTGTYSTTVRYGL